MATLWKHHTLVALRDRNDCEVATLHALRCSRCQEDFYFDSTPKLCPFCGDQFIGEAAFGERLYESQKIREDKILAMLKELKVTTDQILALAQQETQDIATLKALTQAVAAKVKDAAQRMNDAIAALTNGTSNVAQLNAIASELANHHNDLQTLADALNSVGTTADAEQPPAPPAPDPVPDPAPTPDPTPAPDPTPTTDAATTS
jgi:uncharacterized phage infection (PIP) family protein YhgE